MKNALFLLLLVAGGCGGTKTLTAEDFLYAYRSGAMPGEMGANSSATYLGRQGEFHYIELHSGRPADTFVYGVTGSQKARCQADLLPSDFPSGFEPLRGSEGFENSEDSRQYVKEYLARRLRDRPARQGPPPIPDGKGPEE